MKKYILFLATLLVFLAGCGNENTNEGTQGNSSKRDVQFQMRNIDVQVEELQARVAAEVNTNENLIYYKIEQGEEVIQEEQSIEIETQENWAEIQIDYVLDEKMLDKENPPVIHLYVKDDQNNEINSNYVPIDVEM